MQYIPDKAIFPYLNQYDLNSLVRVSKEYQRKFKSILMKLFLWNFHSTKRINIKAIYLSGCNEIMLEYQISNQKSTYFNQKRVEREAFESAFIANNDQSILDLIDYKEKMNNFDEILIKKSHGIERNLVHYYQRASKCNILHDFCAPQINLFSRPIPQISRFIKPGYFVFLNIPHYNIHKDHIEISISLGIKLKYRLTLNDYWLQKCGEKFYIQLNDGVGKRPFDFPIYSNMFGKRNSILLCLKIRNIKKYLNHDDIRNLSLVCRDINNKYQCDVESFKKWFSNRAYIIRVKIIGLTFSSKQYHCNIIIEKPFNPPIIDEYVISNNTEEKIFEILANYASNMAKFGDIIELIHNGLKALFIVTPFIRGFHAAEELGKIGGTIVIPLRFSFEQYPPFYWDSLNRDIFRCEMCDFKDNKIVTPSYSFDPKGRISQSQFGLLLITAPNKHIT